MSNEYEHVIWIDFLCIVVLNDPTITQFIIGFSDYEFDTIKLHSQFKPNLNLHEEVTFNWTIQNFHRFQKLVRGKMNV